MAYIARQFFQNPFLGLTFASAIVELLVLRPGARILAGAIGIGTVLFFLLQSQVAAGGYFGATAIGWLASCGAMCLLAIALQAVGVGGRAEDMVHRARVLFAVFVLVVVLETLNGKFLRFTGVAFPETWDLALATLDSRFGGQPAFAVGRFVLEYNWALNFSFLAYNGLLLGLVSLMALETKHTFGDSLTTFFQFSVAGIIGAGFYLFFPVSGPRYAFSFFPSHDPVLALANLVPSVVVPAARNGMPSLHTAWVVLLFIRARCQGTGAMVCFGVLMVGTIIATLGQGEHYLLDLVVAVPMAVGVSFWNIADVRWSEWLVGGGLVLASLGWVIFLPATLVLLYTYGWLLMTLSVLTVTGPLFVRWRVVCRRRQRGL